MAIFFLNYKFGYSHTSIIQQIYSYVYIDSQEKLEHVCQSPPAKGCQEHTGSQIKCFNFLQQRRNTPQRSLGSIFVRAGYQGLFLGVGGSKQTRIGLEVVIIQRKAVMVRRERCVVILVSYLQSYK